MFYITCWKFHCFSYILCAFLIINSESKTMSKRDVMENINNGLKYAGQVLGINTALDVADLVARAFSPNLSMKKQDNKVTDSDSENLKSQSPSDAFNSAGLFGGLLRLIGFDNSKLGALAINGIILIAQMIGNILISRQSPNLKNKNTYSDRDQNDDHQPRSEQNYGRQLPEGISIDWLLANPPRELSKLLVEIKDRKLLEYLSENVNRLEKQEGEGDCIKLLLCKSAPFVWGMQRSVTKTLEENSTSKEEVTNNDGDRLHAFFKYLPDVEEYKRHGNLCEERYKNCNLTTI